MLPVVVIAGRPNVGESTLFNKLAGRRAALVADTPGVTRDRKDATAMLRGRDFVTPDDVKALAVPTLRHRLVLAPGAEIEGLTAEAEVRRVLEEVAAPR